MSTDLLHKLVMDFTIVNQDADGEWVSIADLMAALMVVFLFISIIYIKPLADEQNKVREIAIAWQASEQAIHQALVDEFEQDLTRWNAEIEASTLLIRFRSPDILFDTGNHALKTDFKLILDDFFPRYIDRLNAFSDDIEEIRIEGHTSSEWGRASPHRAYFGNMALSQARTRSVLEYIMRPGTQAYQSVWLKPLLTANGLSSSQLVIDNEGNENAEESRRVEFRVNTKTRTEIARILETVK